MYVCLCRAVTDKDIKRAVDAGHCNPAAVREQTGAGTGCGRCREHAAALVQKLAEAREPRFAFS
jgi:bacterioferritin-associated ferredoxin